MTETRTPYSADDGPRAVLAPVRAELERALATLLETGYGQVRLIMEASEIRRVIVEMSMLPGGKRHGQQGKSDAGNE